MSSERIFQRLALLAELVRRASLGRTAIMKLFFFLQESRGVRLGYEFSLYSYGPFDSDVLADISTAERLNVLKSNIVYYSSGTGYEYSLGSDVKSVEPLAADFITANTKNIDWVLSNFGNRTAGNLELLSTLLFVAKFHNPRHVRELIDQVGKIKPHFNPDQIQHGFDELVSMEVLRNGPVH